MARTAIPWRWILPIAAFATLAPAPADATTLRRMGLEELGRTNDRVVVGRVAEVKSRWNADGTFILTDVQIVVGESLKGEAPKGPLEITLMGGTVGDVTALIVAGAELVEGREYLLFLSPSDLPGETAELSVRDHCQGAFDVVRRDGGVRVLSQARLHPLLTDDRGVTEPPGGQEGLELGFVTGELGRIIHPTRR